ncbi:hypothetical protein [Micromonospora sp. NPDC004704]
MAYLRNRFVDEFFVATDDEILLVDFWSFLNAAQARLDWSQLSDRVWDYLEELEREFEPVLEGLVPTAPGPFLVELSRRWAEPDEPEAGTAAERLAVRHEVAAMLAEALAVRTRPDPTRNVRVTDGHRSVE